MAGKKLPKISLTELYKRCPSNQSDQFKRFLDKSTEYKRRVNKFPEFLPKIDWDYYRSNVRAESVGMVNEFEQKYVELNKLFDSRVDMDTSKYYTELENERSEVQKNYDEFIQKSNEQIKLCEAEMLRIRSLKAYSEMTMEEFCEIKKNPLRTDEGLPTFWPHTPEEQTPGPCGGHIEDEHAAEEEVAAKPVLTKEAMAAHEKNIAHRGSEEDIGGDPKAKADKEADKKQPTDDSKDKGGKK